VTGVVIEIDSHGEAIIRTADGDLVSAPETGALRVGDRVRYHENEDRWRPLRAAVWVQAR
jgi:hypothetical protein